MISAPRQHDLKTVFLPYVVSLWTLKVGPLITKHASSTIMNLPQFSDATERGCPTLVAALLQDYNPRRTNVGPRKRYYPLE